MAARAIRGPTARCNFPLDEAEQAAAVAAGIAIDAHGFAIPTPRGGGNGGGNGAMMAPPAGAAAGKPPLPHGKRQHMHGRRPDEAGGLSDDGVPPAGLFPGLGTIPGLGGLPAGASALGRSSDDPLIHSSSTLLHPPMVTGAMPFSSAMAMQGGFGGLAGTSPDYEALRKLPHTGATPTSCATSWIPDWPGAPGAGTSLGTSAGARLFGGPYGATPPYGKSVDMVDMCAQLMDAGGAAPQNIGRCWYSRCSARCLAAVMSLKRGLPLLAGLHPAESTTALTCRACGPVAALLLAAAQRCNAALNLVQDNTTTRGFRFSPAVGGALSTMGSLRNELMLPPAYDEAGGDEELEDFMILGTTPNLSGTWDRSNFLGAARGGRPASFGASGRGGGAGSAGAFHPTLASAGGDDDCGELMGMSPDAPAGAPRPGFAALQQQQQMAAQMAAQGSAGGCGRPAAAGLPMRLSTGTLPNVCWLRWRVRGLLRCC